MAGLVIIPMFVEKLSELKRGDHIGVEGEWRGVKYFHHGIYLGNSKVAHFSGLDKKDATVRENDVYEFIEKGKRTLFLFRYIPDKYCLPLEVVAKKAEDMVSNPKQWKPYCPVFNNCEHFSTWCKIDAAVSKQVDDFLVNLLPNIFKVARDAAAKSGIPYCDTMC